MSPSAPSRALTEGERGQLLKLLGMTGSRHDGEAVNALRLAQALMQRHGMAWADLIDNADAIAELKCKLDAAEQACRILLAENDELKEGAEDWRDVDGDHRRQADWALQLARQGRARLNPFEKEFLGTMRSWSGQLTAKQKPILSRIIEKVSVHARAPPPP